MPAVIVRQLLNPNFLMYVWGTTALRHMLDMRHQNVKIFLNALFIMDLSIESTTAVMSTRV